MFDSGAIGYAIGTLLFLFALAMGTWQVYKGLHRRKHSDVPAEHTHVPA